MPFLRKNDEEKTARFFSSRLLFNLFLFPFSFTQLNSTQLAPQLPPLHTHRFPRPPPPTTMIYLRAVVVLFAFALASGHAQARELKRKEFSPRFFLSFFAFDKRSFFFFFFFFSPPSTLLSPPPASKTEFNTTALLSDAQAKLFGIQEQVRDCLCYFLSLDQKIIIRRKPLSC